MLQDPEFQNNLFKLFDGTTKPVVVDKCLYEVQKVTGWKTSVVKDVLSRIFGHKVHIIRTTKPIEQMEYSMKEHRFFDRLLWGQIFFPPQQ